ncbi:kinase-like protein [Polychaeton citri CBS 116435]|uniref:Kinase-like protein n=1 Tax=Polychaeton citri CBS 116435 TaxID=1314669 RepID=A0A9P4QFB9_9PEZI|nr:kinase-like protein [Polychaeton citri CBS 116435]
MVQPHQTATASTEGSPRVHGRLHAQEAHAQTKAQTAQEVQYRTFESRTSPSHNNDSDVAVQTPPLSPQSTAEIMTSSISSLNERLAVSPTIPESREVTNVSSPVLSPMTLDGPDGLIRNSSTRSLRSRAQRIPGMNSRRNSRRSTSTNGASASPAHAFLASWGGKANTDLAPEPQPDDEGQTFGIKEDCEYIIGRQIGKGGFGVVKEVHFLDEVSGKRITKAVKIVRKHISSLNEQQAEEIHAELEHEVSVWRYLKHNYILDLHSVYDTDFATFCVMELVEGGTLFEAVRQCRNAAGENDGRKGMEPALAKRYAYQLACALRYLHEDIRVCHRDIKLENCLLDMSNPDPKTGGGHLRLCDFGLADFLRNESLNEALDRFDALSPQSAANGNGSVPRPTTSLIIGTLEYASPKGVSVQRKLYETAGDVWAFGVIVYALCTGDLPFKHILPSKTVEMIIHAEWDLEALKNAAAGSEDVVELVRGCLETDIDLRLTIGEALRSPWFEESRQSNDEDEGSGNVWR